MRVEALLKASVAGHGGRAKIKEKEMRDLEKIEIESVEGGILPLLAAVWTAYEIADFTYEACKGFKEGYESTAN